MSGTAPSEGVERIVVALDASPQSVCALKAAAELAALMEAEVEGLFVEDMNLIYLGDLPYGREVGSYSATVRDVDTAGMERQLRALAATIHAVMERVAAQTPLRWSFRVRRGCVVDELLAAAQGAALLSVGRGGRPRRARMGSTAQSLIDQLRRPLLIAGEADSLEYPLSVLYTGTPSAQRALALAFRLSRGVAKRLRVVAWDGGDASVDIGQLEQAARRAAESELTHSKAAPAVVRVAHSEDVLAALRALDGGTLVLPRGQAALVANYDRSVLLVP